MAVQECCQASLYPHAGLPCTLWPARVPQADSVAKVHGQENRVPGCHAATRRKTGGSSVDDELFKSNIKLPSEAVSIEGRVTTRSTLYFLE